MNRRDLLTLAPAALVGCAVPVAAACAMPVETPVEALFREWTAARVTEEAAYEANEEDDETIWAARYAVEKRLMNAPCETARDWMLKMVAWANYGEGSGPSDHECPQIWAEVRALMEVEA